MIHLYIVSIVSVCYECLFPCRVILYHFLKHEYFGNSDPPPLLTNNHNNFYIHFLPLIKLSKFVAYNGLYETQMPHDEHAGRLTIEAETMTRVSEISWREKTSNNNYYHQHSSFNHEHSHQTSTILPILQIQAFSLYICLSSQIDTHMQYLDCILLSNFWENTAFSCRILFIFAVRQNNICDWFKGK